MVQSLLFFIRFIFGLYCVNGFFMGRVGLGLGMDSVSYILILLRFWIIALVVGGSQKVKDRGNFSSLFLSVNILLLLRLVLTFCCLDYLIFYVCFESSLIPTLILILG